MMNGTAFFLSVGLVVSSFVSSVGEFLLGEGLAGPLPAQTPFEPIDPPLQLKDWFGDHSVGWYRPYQDANVSYLLEEKQIRVRWAGFYCEVDDSYESDAVLYELDYFPTKVDTLGDDTLLIGGVDETGATILERYDFSWPAKSSVPLPTPTGGLRYHLELPELSRTTRAFYERTPGRKLVRHLLAVQGGDGTKAPLALVQFQDSRDLYTINSGSGRTALIASAQGSQGQLGCVPFLSDRHHFAWKANHADYGYIYVFGFENNVEPSDPPTLVFVDGDRDGEIDNYITVPPGQWTGAWRDEERYLW